MSDKIKLKTRDPSPEFLADTKPAFIPRVRGKKDRAWYRPEEHNDAEATPAQGQAKGPKASDSSDTVTPTAQSTPPESSARIAEPTPEQKRPPTSETTASRRASPSRVESHSEPAQMATPRKGASNAEVRPPKEIDRAPSGIEQRGLTAHHYGERAQALISRAQSSVPQEYLFRQIVMFEMSEPDSSLSFGTLCLSRTGLEQLFGMSEAGVKKARREMESYKLIETLTVGTRSAPTVFKVYSPYVSDKLN